MTLRWWDTNMLPKVEIWTINDPISGGCAVVAMAGEILALIWAVEIAVVVPFLLIGYLLNNHRS